MFSKEFWKEYKWWCVIGLLMFTIVFFTWMITSMVNLKNKRDILAAGLIKVDMGFSEPVTKYVPTKEYFEIFGTAEIPQMYETYDKFYANADKAGFTDEYAGFDEVWDVTEANQALYDLADKYYQVYWGNKRVSPLFPLAIANVETGGRADRSITWSSLYPSAILPISMLYDADVTTVVSDSSYYKPLSTEWSTRDRGAMQMSPTYGTGNEYFNKQMSGNEKDKLSEVDTSKYSSWTSGASSRPGDRFYAPDVCLRLASANTDAIEYMYKYDYIPTSDAQLVCMLSQYHHRSGVWSNKDHSNKCGEWKSSGQAFEFSKKLSSQGFVDVLKKHAKEHPDKFTITRDEALTLYTEYFGSNFNEYTESKLVGCYPITVLYAYIKIGIMYSSL